jgi:hypothetical protein
VRESVWKNLDGYIALELGVARAIHFSHAARAERCEDFVGAEMVSRLHFFSPACQFSTTVMGDDGAEAVSVGTELIRNFWPSAVTS